QLPSVPIRELQVANDDIERSCVEEAERGGDVNSCRDLGAPQRENCAHQIAGVAMILHDENLEIIERLTQLGQHPLAACVEVRDTLMEGQVDIERRSLADTIAVGFNPPAMQLDDLLNDEETEAKTLASLIGRALLSVPVKDARQSFGGDAF